MISLRKRHCKSIYSGGFLKKTVSVTIYIGDC